jgi:cell wall-associated NlpC family hydrolase
MWAWARAGVGLPHNSGAQYGATVRVGSGDWEPGDLLFFGNPIHHVGMYIGNGQMVEAPYSGNSVRVNSASRSDYVGAGRPGV